MQKQTVKAVIATNKTTDNLQPKKSNFEFNSPKFSSPVASGRNTPVDNTSNTLSAQKTKEQLTQELEKLFEKERGGDKPHIHMVVVGHVDAGKRLAKVNI